MAQFDLFVVNVAAPSIQAGLHATPASIQTAVGTYSLTYGAFLITGGRLGDAFGQAFMLRIGMVLFAASSVLCAISQTSIELIAGRVLQGACAAIMVPQVLALALVTRLFPVSERRVATSWFGVTLGLGAVLGQSLGGVLVSHSPFGYGWRTIFLIVVPLSLAASVGVARLLPGRPQNRAVAADPIGLAGFSASAVAGHVCPAGPGGRGASPAGADARDWAGDGTAAGS
jgi:MFS family permease